MAAHVLGGYRYVDENGGVTSLHKDRATPGWDSGDTVQGHVGSSLLDLWAGDGPDGGSWDSTVRLMTREKSDDFREFFTADRPTATPPLATTGAARDIINRHTIDY